MVTLSAVVLNSGDGPAPATTLHYYQSADATITGSDTAVGTAVVEALAASANSSQELEITAPSTPGTYYYGACVGSVAGEPDTTNNCSTSVAVLVRLPGMMSGGICDRTPQVRDAIVDLIPHVDACAAVTDADLAAVGGLLNLRNSGISSLRSDDFAGLTKLESLILTRNQLTTVPAGIFSQLVALQRLRIVHNELESLPSNLFAGLARLDILDLEFNRLTEFPPGLFAGLNLRFLGLEGNQLRTLPAGTFDSISGDLILDLSHNALVTLEDGVFSNLANVVWLDLAVNQLQTLPEGVFAGLKRPLEPKSLPISVGSPPTNAARTPRENSCGADS